jgi:hypothetical protein
VPDFFSGVVALHPSLPVVPPRSRPCELSSAEKLEWSLEVMRILRDLGPLEEFFGKTTEIKPPQSTGETK